MTAATAGARPRRAARSRAPRPSGADCNDVPDGANCVLDSPTRTAVRCANTTWRHEAEPGQTIGGEVTRDLRRAVLLSFDNLGEAADVERETNGALSGDHPSVTV